MRQAIETAPQTIYALRELRTLFTKMTNNDASTSISPSECFTAVINSEQCRAAQMSLNSRQEDAHEFFLQLLEHFDDELTVIAEVFNLPDVFNICLRSTTTCERCFRTSRVNGYLWLLSLHFPSGFAEEAPNSPELNIYSLMDSYLRLEMLPNHPCAQCHFVGSTGKKLDIINSPQVLVIHLSRFDNVLQKIDAFVKFPTELTSEHIGNWNGHPLTYRLRGLIVHEGSSIAGGHYVAYISMNGIWYKADDSEITRVTRQIVSSLKVYILVYQSS